MGLKSWFEDKAKDVGGAVVDKAKDVGGAVVDKAKDVGGAAVDVVEAVAKGSPLDAATKLGVLGGAVLDVAGDVGRAGLDVAGDIGKAGLDVAGDIGKAGLDVAGDVGRVALGNIGLHRVGAGFDKALDELGGAVHGSLDGIGRSVDAGLDGAEVVVDKVLDVPSSVIRGLTEQEVRIAKSVFGDSIDYDQVTVVVNPAVWATNRAFVTGHTINTKGGFDVSKLHDGEGRFESAGAATLIHELTHVWQYERDGWEYAGRSIKDQVTEGSDAYDYGGPTALKAARGLSDFGVEEQAKIIEHYFFFRENDNPSDDVHIPVYAKFVHEVSTKSEMDLAAVHFGTPFDVI